MEDKLFFTDKVIRNAFKNDDIISVYDKSCRRYRILPYDYSVESVLKFNGYDVTKWYHSPHPKSLKLTDFSDVLHRVHNKSSPDSLSKNLLELSDMCTIHSITPNYLFIQTPDIKNKIGIDWGSFYLKIDINSAYKIPGWGGKHTIDLYGPKPHPHPHIYYKGDRLRLCMGQFEKPIHSCFSELDLAGGIDLIIRLLTESDRANHFFGTCDICDEPINGKGKLCNECR